jgi:hypothetical protein
MEETDSSEIFVTMYQTTHRHIPEHGSLHTHGCVQTSQICDDKYLKKLLQLCRIVGSHSGGYEKFCLLRYNDAWSVERQPIIFRVEE